MASGAGAAAGGGRTKRTQDEPFHRFLLRRHCDMIASGAVPARAGTGRNWILRGRKNNAIALPWTHYHGNVSIMPLAQSKLTAQGQISVPSEVRKKLGVGPGSVLVWDEKNDEVIVRRAGRNTSADVHEALFSDGSPKRKTSVSVKEGIRKYIRRKHARR